MQNVTTEFYRKITQWQIRQEKKAGDLRRSEHRGWQPPEKHRDNLLEEWEARMDEALQRYLNCSAENKERLLDEYNAICAETLG